MDPRNAIRVLALVAACSFAQAEDGLPTDELTAKAAQGDVAAQLSLVYLAGDGVAPAPAEARTLAARAAELNDPAGLVVLGEIQFQYGELSKGVLSRPAVVIDKP